MMAMPQVAVGSEGWYGGHHPVAAGMWPNGVTDLSGVVAGTRPMTPLIAV